MPTGNMDDKQKDAHPNLESDKLKNANELENTELDDVGGGLKTATTGAKPGGKNLSMSGDPCEGGQ